MGPPQEHHRDGRVAGKHTIRLDVLCCKSPRLKIVRFPLPSFRNVQACRSELANTERSFSARCGFDLRCELIHWLLNRAGQLWLCLWARVGDSGVDGRCAEPASRAYLVGASDDRSLSAR